MPSASALRGVRTVRTPTRIQNTTAIAHQRAGRVNTSAAARFRPSINRSIGRGPDATARPVAREPGRVLQEVDESAHRCRQPAPAQMDDVPVTLDRETLDIELDQPAAGDFQGAREA